MKFKKTFSVIICSLLLVSTFSVQAQAKVTSINAPYGGVWTFFSFDPSEYNKVGMTKGKPTLCVDRIIYLSPKQVSSLAGKLLSESHRNNYLGQIKSFAYAGATEGTQSLILKYLGKDVASAINPYIGAIGWSYTIISLVDTWAKNYVYSTISSAARENKGLIFKYHTSQDRSGNYKHSGFVYFKWDGSSIYGSYPYVKTPPAHIGNFHSGKNITLTAQPHKPNNSGYSRLLKVTTPLMYGNDVKKVQARLNQLAIKLVQ
ncbi:hypothetical protein QJR26_19005 (plasmid) [Clostridium baratii]